ncbi:MAG TPA: Dabb family protein [Geobacteraceae bacterium]|nr:Dabb family protein [Geobacteraceae bacterium]
MVTHIVLFKLKDKSAESIRQAQEKLLSMNGNVEMLRHLEVGLDVVHSARSYDIALFTKFDSLDDLQAYQVHPYHGGDVAPYMREASEAVAVVDYEA